MVKTDITNKEIRTLFERYIEGKKGKVFFIISISRNENDLKAEALNELSKEFTGDDKFYEVLEEAFDYTPYSISFAFYEKKNSAFVDPPKHFRQVILNKNTKPNYTGLGEIPLSGALGAFGGMEGIIKNQVSAEILSLRTKDLGDNLSDLKAQIETLEKLNGDLRGKNEELKETINKKEWDIRNLEQKHNMEISEVKRSYDKFERGFTIGGMILAQKAGLNANDLRGILGFEPETKSIESGKTNNDNSSEDIDFEETHDFTGKKADAVSIAKKINEFFISLIKQNDEEDALNIINSIGHIVSFIQADFNNLQNLLDFIGEKQKQNQQQS
jgi:regulator of replication initiation timing